MPRLCTGFLWRHLLATESPCRVQRPPYFHRYLKRWRGWLLRRGEERPCRLSETPFGEQLACTTTKFQMCQGDGAPRARADGPSLRQHVARAHHPLQRWLLVSAQRSAPDSSAAWLRTRTSRRWPMVRAGGGGAEIRTARCVLACSSEPGHWSVQHGLGAHVSGYAGCSLTFAMNRTRPFSCLDQT